MAEPVTSGTVDSGWPSRKKLTVPVTVPPPGAMGATVAVNVTGWPKTDGLVNGVSVVVVSDRMTVWLGSDPVLVAKRVTPA